MHKNLNCQRQECGISMTA